MRREILRTALCIYGAVVTVVPLCAQQSGASERALEALLERIYQGANESEELNLEGEELMSYLTTLQQKGEESGVVGAKRLASFGLLDPFELQSYIEYVEQYGAPASQAEFLAIPGVESEKLKLLIPFMRFEYFNIKNSDRLMGRLIARTKLSPQKKVGYQKPTTYLGSPLLLYSKAVAEIPSKGMVIVVAEKDAGERGVDYFSWSLLLKGRGVLNRVVLGSYTAREGQGVVLWNGFSLSNSYSFQGGMKRSYHPEPYGSVDENRAFNGLAISLEKRGWSASILTSHRMLDARVTTQGYTSLLTTGLHNTKTTLERKDALGRDMVAATVAFDRLHFRAGVIALAVKESHLYAGSNKHELRSASIAGKNRGNLSLHWKGSRGSLLYYGEVGLDICTRVAAIAGVMYRGKNRASLSFESSYYTPGFSAPMSTLKYRGNSSAPFFSIIYNKHFKRGAIFDLDLSYSGAYHKVAIRLYNDNRALHNIQLNSSLSRERMVIRVDYRYNHSQNLTLYTKGQAALASICGGNGAGFNLHQELILSLPTIKSDISSRISWFRAKEWQNRLYSYERGLPYQFGTSLLYGEGYRWYLNYRLKIMDRGSLSFKYASFYYVKALSTGEGPEESSGPFKGEFNLQLEVKL